MEEMIISLIIPVYNVEKYLTEFLSSIAVCVGDPEVELLFIDDGSTDNCPNLLDEYSKTGENVKVYHIDNHGVSYARNLGIQEAKGKYIGFLDPDDLVSVNYLNAIKQNILSYKDIYIFGYSVFTKNNSTATIINDVSSIDELTKCTLERSSVKGVLWNKLFCKTIIDQYNIKFDQNIHFAEDLLFVNSFLLHSNSFGIIEDSLYQYRNRKKSGSSFNTYNEKKLTILDAYSEVAKIWKNKGFNTDNIKAVFTFDYYNLRHLYKGSKINSYKKNELFSRSSLLKHYNIKGLMLMFIPSIYFFMREKKTDDFFD